MSGQTPNPTDDFILDGVHFKPTDGSKAQFQAIDRPPGKITVGDYSLDSNDLLSTWIISDVTGGNGVADLKEGVDDSRYRFGDIYTRYPQQFTKPFQIANSNVSTGAFYPLGEMLYSGSTKFYAVGGTDLYEDLIDTTTNITGTPSSKGVAYRGAAAATAFFIPQGNNGCSVYLPGTGLTNYNGGGDPDVQAFVVWDDKLISIDNSGQLRYATDATTIPSAWTSYGVPGKLDSSIEPKTLHVYYNRAGEPHPHIVTDSGVYVFDASTPRLYLIPDFSSNHPYMGVAACVHQGLLYVAAGMDVMEYNGSVVRRDMGLSRDDGLPYQYQGYVRDLVSAQNAMYAFVRGATISGTTYYSVHEYSGYGWHCVYLGSDTRLPTRMVATRAGSTYRLYWGLDSNGKYFYQSLPVSFTNPREAIAAGGYNFGWSGQTTHYLETGRFDANMPGYRKIANAVEVDIRTLPTDATVVIKYRLENDTSWTTLGTATTTGTTVMQFGTADSDGIYPGLGWETIEFRMEFAEPVYSQYTPVVHHLVFSFLKVMNPSISYVLQVDLNATYQNKSPEQLFDKLTELRTSDTFFSLKHGDQVFRVRLANVSGAQNFGKADKRGIYDLSILEIPTKLGAPP